MGELGQILFSIAVSLGLSRIFENAYEADAKSVGTSPDQIIEAIKAITTVARNKGANAVNMVNNKLSAIQLPYAASPAVKDALITARRDLTQYSKQTNKNYADYDAKLANIEERASNLANQDAHYRAYQGKAVLDKLKTEATDVVKDVGNLEKGVEKRV